MDNLSSLVLLAVIIVIAVLVRVSQSQTLDEAKKAYKESLAALSADPTNTGLWQSTLELGRAYSNLTRNRKGVTLFDEVALMNDINAACGGKVGIATPSAPAQAQSPVEDRLERLAQLREKGLIDDEEYRERRGRILEEL